MRLVLSLRKATWIVIALIAACAIGASLFFFVTGESVAVVTDVQWAQTIDELFTQKNKCLLTGSGEDLKKLYIQNEKNSKLAMNAELNRATYLKNWAEKQGVLFTSIVSHIQIKSTKKVGRGYAFFLVASTEYKYVYTDTPDTVNMFRIGTYHTLDLIPGTDGYVISREWYLDPFQDSLKLEKLKTEEIKSYINVQKPKNPTLSDRRKKAVAYADRFSGAAADDEYGFSYNSSYPNFNFMGGDCTNYISQTLIAGGFKRNGAWNYTMFSGSRAWCNAQGFKEYLLYSGRASLIAKGSYKDVYKLAYKLLPGDIISYEEAGKIVHSAIVTGLDSKGYPLVNTHTTDRYHVPWDMGWNDSDIKFYLMHVNY